MTTSPRQVEIVGDSSMTTPPNSSTAGHFIVSAERWSGGWDLHIDGAGLSSGGGVTQVTNLDDADTQVRNYLMAVFEADFSNAVIDIAVPKDDKRFVR